MTTQSSFDVNHPEFSAMKHEMADRTFNVVIKRDTLTLGGAAVGLLGGAAASIALAPVLAPVLGGLLVAAPVYTMIGGGLIGSTIAGYVTMKDQVVLDTDQKIMDKDIEGKGWWGNYRSEVINADHNNIQVPPVFAVPPPPKPQLQVS